MRYIVTVTEEPEDQPELPPGTAPAQSPRREIYSQTVKDLDLGSFIAAINGLQVVAQRRKRTPRES